MIIFSKDKDQIVNFDSISNIYLRGNKVAVNYSNGGGSCIGEYQSGKLAQAALRDILNSMFAGEEICIMDSDERANASVVNFDNNKTSVHHYANGQKTKGHGGS